LRKNKGSDNSRNDKKVQQDQHKSENTDGSLKEDIIIDIHTESPQEDVEDKNDDKNIVGSQSLDDTTPSNAEKSKDNPYADEEGEKTDSLNNSDSKYATVSILSELIKQEKDEKTEKKNAETQNETNDTTMEENTADRLCDLIYSAMVAEIKAELFPPRPLFLLTADLEKIDLEQALIYLNDMSVEKEAALLKEYLRYSGGDDSDLISWEADRNERDSDESKMFSDSGKLVLYERKGISTDLFSIEKYVDELASEVDDKCKPKFLTDTFSPLK
jgi:hypothetical protein